MSLDLRNVPPDVLLVNAPLIRVICQVRYSSTPELVDDDRERVIARALSSSMPVRGETQGSIVSIPNVAPSSPVEFQRFRTFENQSGTWKATVTTDFVALETSAYTRRADFLDRLGAVLKALDLADHPAKITRIGTRFTDRIVEPTDLVRLVRPSLLGLLPHVEDSSLIENQFIQALITQPETTDKVQVRSLFLPPNVGFDPSLAPVDQESWVLDIDSFNVDAGKTWSVDEIQSSAETLAKLAYQVFYWSTTDEFRAIYGSEK